MESAAITVQGLHYMTGQPVKVSIEQQRIAGVEPLESVSEAAAASSSAALPWIGPGLFDLQINGYRGMDFNTLPIPPDTTRRISRALWREGVTSYYPTVITNSETAIMEAVRSIADECEQDADAAGTVAGIHLEGPFISPEDGARGAHARAWVRAPDWSLFERWQEAANGKIRIVTLSPEWPQAEHFIRRCVDSGVIVSIGHTAAAPEQIKRAAAAGATMSTHFGNGAHSMLPRHPNYLWEQLAADELWACLIADGFHLPDAVLKVVMKVKGDMALLVSDAVALSGMPAGTYRSHIGGEVVLTPEGRLHLADQPQLLAGSAQMLLWGISHLVRRGLRTLGEAWEMASTRPARLVGHPASAGLQIGAPADLLLLEWAGETAQVVAAYKQGKKVYAS